MKFKYVHNNINVFDLDKSVEFYQKALGMTVARRKEASDGSFILMFMTDEAGIHQVELTWLRDRKERYNLGDNEIHMAFHVDEYEAAKEFHREMGVICYENDSMGVYFIADPDGFWIEIIPEKR